MIFIVLVLTVVYGGLMVFFILGGLRLGQTRRTAKIPFDESLPALPSVSVIVPLRNEEAHAHATLSALSKQDYTGEWEIICINDRSTDNTESIIRGFCNLDTKPYPSPVARFSLVNIPLGAPKIPSPKKRALAAGFAVAKGDI